MTPQNGNQSRDFHKGYYVMTVEENSQENQDSVPSVPVPDAGVDGESLRKAHSKYGDYLKKAGLPFEDDELDGAEPKTPDQKAEQDS